MKKFNRLMAFMLALVMLGVASSCDDDEPTIGGGDGGGDLLLADGYYLAKEGEDPASGAQLKSATVDAPENTAMDREGFVQGYMYLTAGSYTLVEVSNKEVVTTIGGESSAVSGEDVHNPECDVDNSGYNLVAATTDGASFSIGTDGLYVVGYDATLSEIIYDQMTSVGIIGAATPDGWGADTGMTGSFAAEGGSWTVEGVTLDVGEMKFRYNCRWAIDRRIDKDLAFDNANGYSMFTNYGNALDNLLPGNEGTNIQIDEYAVYTVTFDWTPGDIPTATATKTGEAEEKPDYPETMYLVGGGTAYGWDEPATVENGAEMHKIAGGTPNVGIYWKICHLEAGQGFKISAANWKDPNLGFDGVDEYDADGVTVITSTDGDGNMEVAASGMYMIVLNLQDGMKKVSIVSPEVYAIGDAFGGYDEDVAGNLYTIDNTAKTLTSPALTADGNIRSYVNHAWISDWWNAEFVVVGTDIEYRNDSGDDPTAVAGTTGQVITLSFDDNTGSIQ